MWYEEKYKELKDLIEVYCSKICQIYKYPKRFYIKYIN